MPCSVMESAGAAGLGFMAEELKIGLVKSMVSNPPWLELHRVPSGVLSFFLTRDFFFLGFRVLPPLLSHILEKPLSLFRPLKTHCLCKGDRNPVVEKIENLFEVDKNTGMTSTLSKVSDKKVEKMLEDVTAWERPFTPNQVRFSSFPIFSLSIDFSFVFF